MNADVELPSGWRWSTLGEACDLNPHRDKLNGASPDTPVTFVPMPAVDAALGVITSPQIRALKDVQKGYTSFRQGDVIMAKITPCMENGKAAVVQVLENGLGFGSTEFHVLRPNGQAIAEFLYHFIRQESFRRLAESNMTGSVGQRRVPAAFLRDAPVPLPPIEEQRRIATKLDDLLGRVAATRERLDRVPTILRRFRQSVLAAAVSGRLTEDLNGGADDPHPQGWCATTLGELASLVTSGSRGWAKYYSDDGPLFIRSEDINTDALRITSAAHVSPPASGEGLRTRVFQNDILITITGANVTKTAVVVEPVAEAYVSQHVGLVRLRQPSLSRFVHLCLLSERHGRGQLRKAAYGAGKPGLNLTNLREVPLALPPSDEAEEILRRTLAILGIGERVAARSQAAARAMERMRETVLARAFRGELVPAMV